MATACYNFFPNCNARESAFFVMFERVQIHKLNMLLHSARRYFHDDNRLPNLEALKNIYQVVAQQFLNSRECYVKKHHNQQQSESPFQVQTAFSSNYANFFLPVSSLLRIRSARCSLGNGSERLCTSRPLLGSYVHQESI